MRVDALDHLVLTVTNLEATVAFYCSALGMIREDFRPADGSLRTALKFGHQKINLHVAGAEFNPKAIRPTAGSADLCFLTSDTLANWQTHFAYHKIDIEEGPVTRKGATGPITSLYVRDPDANLIEVSVRG